MESSSEEESSSDSDSDDSDSDSDDTPLMQELLQGGVARINKALEEGVAHALYTAMGERSLAAVPRERRAAVRADMMKQVLLLQLA